MYDLPSAESEGGGGTLVDLLDDDDLEMMWEEMDVVTVRYNICYFFQILQHCVFPWIFTCVCTQLLCIVVTVLSGCAAECACEHTSACLVSHDAAAVPRPPPCTNARHTNRHAGHAPRLQAAHVRAAGRQARLHRRQQRLRQRRRQPDRSQGARGCWLLLAAAAPALQPPVSQLRLQSGGQCNVRARSTDAAVAAPWLRRTQRSHHAPQELGSSDTTGGKGTPGSTPPVSGGTGVSAIAAAAEAAAAAAGSGSSTALTASEFEDLMEDVVRCVL